MITVLMLNDYAYPQRRGYTLAFRGGRIYETFASVSAAIVRDGAGVITATLTRTALTGAGSAAPLLTMHGDEITSDAPAGEAGAS